MMFTDYIGKSVYTDLGLLPKQKVTRGQFGKVYSKKRGFKQLKKRNKKR